MTPEIKKTLEEYSKLLPVNGSVSYTEAERRAGKFLEAQAQISEWRHILSEEKIRLVSQQAAVYAEELSKCTGKTVTENKVTVEANSTYQRVREDFEYVENDVSYLKAYYEIFNNAHIFYRTMSKGEGL
jgi:hypothetical protein